MILTIDSIQEICYDGRVKYTYNDMPENLRSSRKGNYIEDLYWRDNVDVMVNTQLHTFVKDK